MKLHEHIKKESREALKERDTIRLRALRNILAALTNDAVTHGKKPSELLDDEAVLTVMRRLAKQHRESIEQFEKGGREDLAAEEKEELVHLEKYLPAMMSENEIKTVVEKKKQELGIADLPAQAGKSGVGQLMGAVMTELKGRADGTTVKKVVEEML